MQVKFNTTYDYESDAFALKANIIIEAFEYCDEDYAEMRSALTANTLKDTVLIFNIGDNTFTHTIEVYFENNATLEDIQTALNAIKVIEFGCALNS